MSVTYCYRGNDTVGEYVARCLEQSEFERVTDVSEAEIVLTHCYHLGAIEDMYFEDDGLIKLASEGTLLVDLSASTPSLSRELSAVATVNDLRFVEAPLAPEDPFSRKAWNSPEAMVCFISGETDDCDAVRPIMNMLASKVFDAGNYGGAQLAKAMQTTLQAASVMGAIEANALFCTLNERGYSEGSDPILDIPFGHEFDEVSKLIASHEFSESYTIALFMSDVAAAMATADDGELILPHLEAALHISELAGMIGGADRGLALLGLLYRDEALGAEEGLDWTRAESLYAEPYNAEEAYPEPPDDDYDFSGGFGDYYAN